MRTVPAGLYAITDPVLTPSVSIAEKVKLAILGGARMVQYRDNASQYAQRERQAAALVRLCNEHRVPLIVNNDVGLARQIGAHGAHLGRNDMRLSEARALLGRQTIIGVSCYDDFTRAEQAREAGADYVAFGSFFASTIKPEAPVAGLDLLTCARCVLELPVCAIGGITADNAAPLIRAGADLIAVASGVFAQPEPKSAARRIAALFEDEHIYG
jgi:thiamine-phosphate pyrophosphorylase